MDDFSGILERDFGFRPGKAAPMAASKAPTSGSASRQPAGTASWNNSRSDWNTDSLLGDRVAGVSGSGGSPPAYDDVFLGPGEYLNSASRGRAASSAPKPPTDFDSIFDGFKDSAPKPANSSPPPSSMPVFDKPLYDDDIFDGVPGLKTTSSVNYDDVFASMASGSDRVSPPPYEDLLENLGKPIPKSKGKAAERSSVKGQDLSGFDELIPGFGGSSPPNKRGPSEPHKEETSFSSAKPSAPVEEDPFKVFESVSASTYSSSGLFTDPLEHAGRPVSSRDTKVDTPPVSVGVFDELSKPVPSFATEASKSKRDQSPQKYSQDMNPGLPAQGRESSQQASVDAFENIFPTMQPSKAFGSQKSVSRNGFHSYNTDDNNSMADQSPKYHEHMETADDIWLTVAEIPLFTQPTNAPPPSRPPPPLVTKRSSANRKDNEFSMQSTKRNSYFGDSVRKSDASPIDELEDFAMGKTQMYTQHRADFFTGEEEIETSSSAAASAAAMKEAMDQAEAKFKHAKEVRERERDAKIAKSRESQQQERDFYGQDVENKEEQEKLDREKEEEEKEQRRLERVRERELERERERKAVERATREARERAAVEARQRAEREKVEAEKRERERAAVQRAAAEARQRAAAEAWQRAERERADRERAERERIERERAEKERVEKERAEREKSERERADRERVEREKVERNAAEARERASAERMRAERMAVERAAAEARKRAAEDARRRAAAAAAAATVATEEKQRKSPEEDLESFFGMGARATSAPTQRPTSSDNLFNSQFQTKGPHNASSVSSSTIKKASSTTNIVDDLSAIFGGPPSSGEFQDIEGESEERRRARLERHQRTAERAQKALAEKNERDRQAQMEQAERHRIGETLDFELKRWAAGKEGNLRALLSTLQYVLWPECGWQPVSLTDLITAAAVKKVYRKATLCIHPDKVQQKGATIQQKYIAEKVFDLLKEAWNKFNSEELF